MPTQNKHQSKQHTKRFRKSEAAFSNVIFRLLIKHRGKLTVSAVARELHMSRQAFYIHYHDINAAIMECEEMLLRDFCDFLANRCPDDSKNNNRRLITVCFIFMSQRRTIFREIGENMIHQHIIYRMLEVVFPRLRIIWLPAGAPAPVLGSERVDIYLRCVAGVLCRWASECHCDIGKSEQYIRQLLRLTEEIGTRNTLELV